MGIFQRRQPDFDRAFIDLYPRACRAAQRIVGDWVEAEDVAAEALSRALARWRQIKDLDHRDAWIMRVTTNLAVDNLRRRRRTVPAVVTTVGAVDEIVAERVDVGCLVDRLSRRQREVMLLRFFADLPEREVAHCLGLSVETVKEHTARAMTTLRLVAVGANPEGGDHPDAGITTAEPQH